MKAIEYYNEYQARIMNPTIPITAVRDTVIDLMLAFVQEVQNIETARHAKTVNGKVAIFKEQNQKWNALCRIFKKKHGISPLIENGFLTVAEEHCLGLKKALEDDASDLVFRKAINGRINVQKGIKHNG